MGPAVADEADPGLESPAAGRTEVCVCVCVCVCDCLQLFKRFVQTFFTFDILRH